MRTSLMGFTLALALLPGLANAEDPCAGFKWDVSREKALFAGPAAAVESADGPGKAPTVETGRLYELALRPQESLRFAAPPSKKMLADGASAGIVKFRVPRAGSYRVALSRGFWVDVIEGQNVIPSSDFGGVPGCESPRKLVLYPLPADRDLFLQLSGASEEKVRVSITEVPPAPR